MTLVTLAATQMACGDDPAVNLACAEALVREAALQGAQVILIQELFEGPYFCKDQRSKWFETATATRDNAAVRRFSQLAQELGVVLPVSFFEKAGPAYFNTVAMIDADGTLMGTYRKSHIPQGVGYEEKFYFSPGDTGFRVWPTRFGTIGVGICWDQWFPETARSMALMGADVLLYPTAIGSEPLAPEIDSRDHWRRAMQGHAAANVIPVVASNRVGFEQGEERAITFYGSSFISDHTGGLLAEMDRTSEGVITATVDLAANAAYRSAWGLFRDRRPELYHRLSTYDGL